MSELTGLGVRGSEQVVILAFLEQEHSKKECDVRDWPSHLLPLVQRYLKLH